MALHTRIAKPRPAALDLDSAKRVLKLEAEGLNALADSLDDEFAKAIDVLAHVKGRIVVTGMGKSGHIGRKIAASLASTGAPAFFVHPGEASHGDLGMVTQADAILALSNSGETAELSDFIAYSSRFSIPMISISSRSNSTLAEAATVSLVLPAAQEACSLGLAPTTSTTMTLAMGDCLTVALLERRGFSADDFQQFHPGGSLGNQLMKVKDLMHSGEAIPLVSKDTLMSDTLLEMTAKHFGCVAVVDEKKVLLGIITDGDLRRHMTDDLIQKRAGDIMTTGAKTIGANALAVEGLAIMNEKAITSLFVLNDETMVHGVLHIHDCLRAGIV
ncbi:D-arabinose 5-phosphate isomerase [Candidatus Terasakiella magnetica]|uniref:D-arabinose 5-phosphate isomerase n=1 Tax=Candidatus Terasakiella magnetica TaxID=1867952 RepID=A0A1C3RDY0_9PROT|nr:KpsF/GutQ family sugar-phosphate isomerase [Candidatus Terasakiella magnetica]SCA55448.1 D-arabinose 5-phosphate isomerase [Candidatus Terasakiella magnetica]